MTLEIATPNKIYQAGMEKTKISRNPQVFLSKSSKVQQSTSSHLQLPKQTILSLGKRRRFLLTNPHKESRIRGVSNDKIPHCFSDIGDTSSRVKSKEVIKEAYNRTLWDVVYPHAMVGVCGIVSHFFKHKDHNMASAKEIFNRCPDFPLRKATTRFNFDVPLGNSARDSRATRMKKSASSPRTTTSPAK